MKRILLVDDEPNLLQALRRTLVRAFPVADYRIELFDDPRQALERAVEVSFDVVISDFRMPPMSGVEFLKAFRELQPDCMRMILSASTDFDALMSAVNEAEVLRYLVKPWSDEELVEVVRGALARHDTLVEDRQLADEVRLSRGTVSAEELERRRLEAEEPGITRVKWGPGGSVILDDE
ncbi:MAG: response regulator [Zoogloeaceae bacterium]|nr:response regulator [Zoogloeaceae bacterium]